MGCVSVCVLGGCSVQLNENRDESDKGLDSANKSMTRVNGPMRVV